MNHNHQRRQRNELKNVEQTLKEEANHNKNEQLQNFAFCIQSHIFDF